MIDVFFGNNLMLPKFNQIFKIFQKLKKNQASPRLPVGIRILPGINRVIDRLWDFFPKIGESEN